MRNTTRNPMAHAQFNAQSFKLARISRASFSNLSMASSNSSIVKSAISNPTSLLVTGTGQGSFSVNFKGWLKKMKRKYIFDIVFKVKKKYPYHSGNVKLRMDIASLLQIGQFSILGWQFLQMTCPLLQANWMFWFGDLKIDPWRVPSLLTCMTSVAEYDFWLKARYNRIDAKYRQMAFRSVPTNPYLESLVKRNWCKFRGLCLHSTSVVILPNTIMIKIFIIQDP